MKNFITENVFESVMIAPGTMPSYIIYPGIGMDVQIYTIQKESQEELSNQVAKDKVDTLLCTMIYNNINISDDGSEPGRISSRLIASMKYQMRHHQKYLTDILISEETHFTPLFYYGVQIHKIPKDDWNYMKNKITEWEMESNVYKNGRNNFLIGLALNNKGDCFVNPIITTPYCLFDHKTKKEIWFMKLGTAILNDKCVLLGTY